MTGVLLRSWVAMKPRYGTCPTSSSAELRAALAQYTARDRDQVRLDLDEAVRQTLMRLESAQMFLENAPWRDFFPAGPAGRLTWFGRVISMSRNSTDRYCDRARAWWYADGDRPVGRRFGHP
jgi:hypothetical protein